MSYDPRNEHLANRPGHSTIPWLWLGLGGVVAIIGLVVLMILLTNYLVRSPENTADMMEPSIIQLTAPPQPTLTIAHDPPTPTIAPTATTAPTPDLSVAPDKITVGYYARVTETGGVGVTVRNGPSTSNQPVVVASEGSIIMVTGGPTRGGEYDWWQVRLSDGAVGWVAGDFLTPSAAPR
ncbi:MAG TPA: SH3 domain-containing protein [Promineifilum sp.]|nr:SH3 domain-containing protein [Promineifilum sp.]